MCGLLKSHAIVSCLVLLVFNDTRYIIIGFHEACVIHIRELSSIYGISVVSTDDA